MEKRLFDATLEGDVSALETMIQENPLILERSLSLTSFHETPLHVAVLRGHLEFAKALLSHNPKLATQPESMCSACYRTEFYQPTFHVASYYLPLIFLPRGEELQCGPPRVLLILLFSDFLLFLDFKNIF